MKKKFDYEAWKDFTLLIRSLRFCNLVLAIIWYRACSIVGLARPSRRRRIEFLAGATGRRKTVLCLRNYFVRKLFLDRATLNGRCDRWGLWWRWFFYWRWFSNWLFMNLIYLFYYFLTPASAKAGEFSFDGVLPTNSRNRWRAHHRRRKTVLVSVGVAFYWISFLRGGRFWASSSEF